MSGSLPGAPPITFDYNTWVLRYPEFSGVSQALAQLYFNEACLYVDNTGYGPITDPNMLTLILNMVTAHIAALNSPKSGDTYNSNGTEYGTSLVGRITDAQEGTVSVSAQMAEETEQAAWWNQTKYGAAAYKALLPFRTAIYLPSMRRRRFNPPIWNRNMSPW
jgi:hypothetical protein